MFAPYKCLSQKGDTRFQEESFKPKNENHGGDPLILPRTAEVCREEASIYLNQRQAVLQ